MWFEASKDKSDLMRIGTGGVRPAREPPRVSWAEPNRWGSYFGSSFAWEYCPERGKYYLHQFSKKQPDLNWERILRCVVRYDMMNWWLDRGVDGFRMDVITSFQAYRFGRPSARRIRFRT